MRGLTRLATDWIEVGDFARAEGVIDARAELAARIGHPRYLWQTPLLRSMLAMPKGDFALCDDAIEEATAIGQEGRDVNAIALMSGVPIERARITVQRRVREAIKKIADHEADLGRHLDWAVRTGTYCAYEPLGRVARTKG